MFSHMLSRYQLVEDLPPVIDDVKQLPEENCNFLGCLLFSIFMMDMKILKVSIMDAINGILIGLLWKIIFLGIQGQIKLEDQVKALNVHADEMDVLMAKWCMMALYKSQTSEDHKLPLNIHMRRLVLEMDSTLNTKGTRMWKISVHVRTHQ